MITRVQCTRHYGKLNTVNTSTHRLTIIVTYYNEPHFLTWWYDKFQELKKLRPGLVRLLVVDDGSMRQPAINFLTGKDTSGIDLFVVTEDVGFNSHGSRNLAMKATQTDWNMFSDIDRAYPTETLLSIIDDVVNDQLDAAYTYKFTNPKTNGEPSLNEYVVHRDNFWKAGGYDEEFTNFHWGDRLFLETLHTIAPPVPREDWHIAYTRGARKVEYSEVDTTQYPDDGHLFTPSFWKSTKLRASLIEYVTERNKIPQLRKRKPILNFPWKQLL